MCAHGNERECYGGAPIQGTRLCVYMVMRGSVTEVLPYRVLGCVCTCQ